MALLILTAPAEEIPAIYKSSPYFSNAIGSGSLTVTASAEPRTIMIGESMVLTINVENVRNPADVKRPLIETTAFAIENLDAKAERNRVAFRYRVKPRAADVTEIPSVRFDYYFPEAAEEKRLRTKYTAAIPIVVKAKVEANATPSFAVPERFQTFVEVKPMPWTPEMNVWMEVMVGSGFASMAWVLVWKYRNPQGARLTALKRNRVVRNALAAIERDDPIAALRNYLHERFEIPSTRRTPTEFKEELLARQFGEQTVSFVELLLREDDEVRYGGNVKRDFANPAREAILLLEVKS